MQTVPHSPGGTAPVFVLLDDDQSTPAHPGSRLYTGFVEEHVCTDPADLDALSLRVDTSLRAGLHAALLIDYEWGFRLQRSGARGTQTTDAALRILLFRQCQRLCAAAVDAWLAEQDPSPTPSVGGIADLQPSVSPTEFHAALDRIQQLLRSGASYQINYTYRLHGSQYGSVPGLYRRLRALQPVPFGALIRLPSGCAGQDTEWVLSRSPELLVQHTDRQLVTRPMKGTASRSSDPVTDAQRARWLAQDPKNLAENVMIVDLLRNDLGRIAETGSVQVPQRFQVETYATVHQMTSTVRATLRPDVGLPALLRAVFPCGSITGAPKLHSMESIAALESTPRGLYCGAIGWLDAPHPPAMLGNLCLSVAIRTLTLGSCQNGTRPATLGVGSGIVLDSDATHEYRETRWKARFLTAVDPGIGLFETLRWQNGRLCQPQAHLQRLQRSAQALGFHYDADAVLATLTAYTATLDRTHTLRVRLDLDHAGHVRLQHALLQPLPAGPVSLVLARQPLPPAQQALRQHKTTLRTGYDAAIAAAAAHQAFDAIFVNTEAEVTEGARSNLLAKVDGRWCTPALECGVLPGVMRARVLQRWPAVEERVLRLDQLLQAEELAVCNALRGLRRARWHTDASGMPLMVETGAAT